MTASSTNPLQGMLGNPLLAAGIQFIGNMAAARQGYRGRMPGVLDAARNAIQWNQAQGLNEENIRRQRDEWQYQDRQRAAREQAMGALQGLLGNQQKEQQGNQQLWNESMADEPASVQAMGAPQYPANPLNPQAIQSIMMGGDSAMQNSAITSALQGQTTNRPVVVGNSIVDPMTGRVVYKGEGDPNALTFEQRMQLAQARSGQNGGQPYFQAVPFTDENGNPSIGSFNARTGKMEPVTINGMNPVKSSDSAPLQGAIAGAKKGATVEADARANARLNLPQAEANANATIGLVKSLRDHPGMSQVVGAPSLLTLGGRVPATEGANFRARLDQLQGQQFLQAYETLKGGGQITEAEGAKAQNAIARMQTSQSEVEFKKAANEFIGIIEAGLSRAKMKAGGANPVLPSSNMEISPNQGGIKFLGFE